MDVGWTLLAGIGAAQSLFLSALLAARRTPEARCLASVLGVLAVLLGEEVVDFAGLGPRWPALVGIGLAAELLLGPLVLAFARALRGRPPSPGDSIHLVPFALAQVALIPFLLAPLAEKLQCLRMGGCPVVDVVLTVKGPVLLVYLVAAWRSVPRDRGRLLDILARQALTAALLLGLGTLVVFHLGRLGVELPFDSDRLAGLGTVVLIHVLGLAALWPRRPPREEPYSSSSLGAGRRRVIARRLDELLEGERPWLDPELDLAGLAGKLNTTPHHLSQVLTEEVGRGFYDLVTAYRVAEVQRLLGDRALAQRPVLELGHAAGFASKASFYRAFRRETGTTPTRFRRERLAGESPSAE